MIFSNMSFGQPSYKSIISGVCFFLVILPLLFVAGSSVAFASAPTENVSSFSPAGYASYPKPDVKYGQKIFNNGNAPKWKEKDWKKFNPLVKDLTIPGSISNAWYGGTPSPLTCLVGLQVSGGISSGLIPTEQGKWGHGKCLMPFSISNTSGLRIATISANPKGYPKIQTGVNLTLRKQSKKPYWAYEAEGIPKVVVTAGTKVTIAWACQPNQSGYAIAEWEKAFSQKFDWAARTVVTQLADRSRNPSSNLGGTGNGKLSNSQTVTPPTGKTTAYTIQCGGYEPYIKSGSVNIESGSLDIVGNGGETYSGCNTDGPGGGGFYCYKGYVTINKKNSSYYHPEVSVKVQVCDAGAEIKNGKCTAVPKPPETKIRARVNGSNQAWNQDVAVAYGSPVTVQAQTVLKSGDSSPKTGIWQDLGATNKKKAVADGKNAFFDFTNAMTKNPGTYEYFPQTRTSSYENWKNHSKVSIKIKVCKQGQIPQGSSCGDATVNIVATDADANEEDVSDTGTFRFDRGAGNTTGVLRVDFLVGGSASRAGCGSTNPDYHLEGDSSIDCGSGDVAVDIQDGERYAFVTLVPHTDNVPDDNETAVLTLAAGGYVVGPNSAATVTISDNDSVDFATLEIAKASDGVYGNSVTISEGEEVWLRWDSNAGSCNGFNFPTGGASTDSIENNSIEEPSSPGGTYGISCSNGENSSVSVSIIGDLSLTASDYNVRKNEAVTLHWNAIGRDPASCSLSGPDLNGYGTLPSVEGETSPINILAESTFILTCDPGINGVDPESVSVKINLIPQIFES